MNKHLKKLIAFPTETVYGLGASAFDPDAIQAVFDAKGRPSDNPLIVHIADKEQAADFAFEIPDDAKKLMDAFWPGPLTLVLKKRPEVLDIITAGLDTVAIRMPNHPAALQLLKERGPMVAPSANKSGRPSPTTAAHVAADFGESIKILDGGKCNLGLESTVIDCSEIPYTILRPGHISAEEITALTRKIVETKTTANGPARSPGLKYSHYAPEANVRWLMPNEEICHQDVLYLVLDGISTPAENVIFYEGNLNQLASELYDRFRQADLEAYREIAISYLPTSSSGIAAALRNRIEKASG